MNDEDLRSGIRAALAVDGEEDLHPDLLAAFATGDLERTSRVADLIAERLDIGTTSILDLGCRAGAFSIRLGGMGAQILGIEGRGDNFALARAAARRCKFPRSVRFEQSDVRRLSRDRHGVHDVTLCLGLLYHLSAVDAVRVLLAMRECTTKFAIIDTHVASEAETVEVDGVQFWGAHHAEDTSEPWSSIGNSSSWWFSSDSLCEALYRTGWTTVERIPGHAWPGEATGRLWVVVS